jgi:hypothetical protein
MLRTLFCVCARDAYLLGATPCSQSKFDGPFFSFSPLQYLFTIRRCSGLSDEKVIGSICTFSHVEFKLHHQLWREKECFSLTLLTYQIWVGASPYHWIWALERSPVRPGPNWAP